MTETQRKPKLLFVVSEDWYFCSHRLPLAVAACQQGYEVAVATRVNKHGIRIKQHGLTLIPLRHLRRTSLNPWREMRSLIELWKIYRRVKPDIVHHVAIKPVLYGSMIARLMGISRVINALAGMGYLFTTKRLWTRIASQLIVKVLTRLFNRAPFTLILQNRDDKLLWHQQAGVREENIALIRGSGVDLQKFAPYPEPAGIPVIVCATRMLKDKGIEDLVEAAKILARKRIRARIVLCGPADDDNPSAISAQQLRQWQKDTPIEWVGMIEDIAKQYNNCHIAVLPSYREGLPKSLIEAAAAGLPIVTTNVPGCREVVENGRNGLLVPPRNPIALAEALGILINHPSLRRKFGQASRKKAEKEFAEELIIAQTLAVYKGEKNVVSTKAHVDAA